MRPTKLNVSNFSEAHRLRNTALNHWFSMSEARMLTNINENFRSFFETYRAPKNILNIIDKVFNLYIRKYEAFKVIITVLH